MGQHFAGDQLDLLGGRAVSARRETGVSHLDELDDRSPVHGQAQHFQLPNSHSTKGRVSWHE